MNEPRVWRAGSPLGDESGPYDPEWVKQVASEMKPIVGGVLSEDGTTMLVPISPKEAA
jgi:predicted transcriptional regulator